MNIRLRLIATSSYIGCVVLLNTLFVYLPGVAAFGQSFSPADMLVGVIYLVRDFAQREIRHYVIIAMIVGGAISYLLADRTIALASVAGFFVGEGIDWAIYTYTKRPLSKRLMLSAVISSPFDSLAFLIVANRLHWLPYLMMTLGKLTGVVCLWLLWKWRSHATQRSLWSQS